jgi:hypothetical protein
MTEHRQFHRQSQGVGVTRRTARPQGVSLAFLAQDRLVPYHVARDARERAVRRWHFVVGVFAGWASLFVAALLF